MRIPVYTSQTEAGSASIPAGGGEALRGELVPDLSVLPTIAAQIKHQQQLKTLRLEEDDARYWLGLQSSAFRKESSQYLQEQANKMPEGGAGFTAGIDAYLETRAKQIRNQAPNKFASDMWDVESANLRAQTFGHALNMEAAESGRFKQKAVGETVLNNSAFLYQDGHVQSFGPTAKESQFKKMRDQSLDMIRALPVAGAQKDAIVQGMDKEYAQSFLYNQLNNDPRGLLGGLKSGQVIKYLQDVGITPDQNMLQSFLGMAENKLRSEDSQSKDEVTRWMKNNIDSVSMNGQEFNPPMTPEAMRTLVGDTTWKNYEDNIAVAWGVRKGIASILENPSPNNVAAVINQARSNAVGLESSRNKDIYDGLTRAWNMYQDVLVKDGHTLAMQSLAGADVQMLVAGQLHTNDAIARAAYSVQYQKTAGVPEESINIMGVDEAKQHVTNLVRMAPEAAQNYLQEMQTTYGPFYEKAYRQLSQSGLPTGYKLTLWGMETPVGDILTNVSRKPVKELEEASALPSAELTSIQQDVRAKLKPFVNTILFGDSAGVRSDYAQSMYNEVYKTVLSRMATGESRGDAIKYTVQALVTDRYYIQPSFYIPKVLTENYANGKQSKEPLSEKTVMTKLGMLLDGVDKFEPTSRHIFQSNLSGLDQREILLKAIKEDGYWLNNEDGTGVYRALTVSGIKGVPVLNAKGQRFEFRWFELKGLGPTTSGKIRRQ